MKPIYLLLLLAINSVLLAQVPTNGLVAYYPFNGNANDASGNANNGTVVNASLTTDRFGHTNSAYSFDQTSSYIQVPDAPSLRLTTAASFSVWINIASDINYYIANGGPHIFAKGATPTIYSDYAFLLPNGQSQFETVDSNGTPTFVTLTNSPLPQTTWIHLCLVYQGDTVAMYNNSVLVGTQTTLATLGTSFRELFIGSRYVLPAGGKFKGSIDDFRIYNRALNLSEIQALYYEGSGLVAYYPFNGSAIDASGNGNDLTVDGAILTSDRFGVSNRAFHFDGSSTYMRKIEGVDFTSDFTMSAWISPNDATSWGIAVGVGQNSDPSNNVRIGYHADSRTLGFNAYIDGWTGVEGSKQIPVGHWTYVAGIRSGSTWKVYVNGVLDGSAPGLTGTLSNLNVGVAKHPGPMAQDYFKGDIDDIRFYNRALTDAEIQALYHEGGMGGLVAYYPLNGNANDESGNGQNGTVNGAVLSSDRKGVANSAYSFTGGAEIALPNAFKYASFSFCAWVNSAAAGYDRVIFSEYQDINNYLKLKQDYKNDEIGVFLKVGGSTPWWSFTSSVGSAPLNQWNFVCLVLNSTTDSASLYVNGKLDGQAKMNGYTPAGLGTIANTGIGHAYDVATDHYQGKIDDIRIYSRALSATEIDSLYGQVSVSVMSPLRNALGVNKSMSISATFHEAVATSSVTGSTVLVSGSLSGKHTGAISFSNGNQTMTFDPAVDFRPGEVVSVTLTKGIIDASGVDTLSNGYHWQFTVGGVTSNTGTLGTVVSGTAPSGAYDVGVGDVDSDGDLDFITNSSTGITVFKNNGSAAFTNSGSVSIGYSTNFVAMGDVDNNGTVDAVVSNGSNPDAVWVFKNNGTGTFTNSGSTSIVDLAGDVVLGDVDGDGDLDLFVGVDFTTSGAQVMFNNGSGTYTQGPTYSGAVVGSVHLADLDNDGDLDVVLSVGPANQIQTWRNDGSGTFSAWNTYATAASPSRVRCTDLNGDGNLDIVVSASSAVSVFLGSGGGAFAAKVDYPTTSGTSYFALGDIDGDNDIDIVATCSTANTVSLLKNNGNGTFASKVDYSVPGGVAGIAIADFNGDNKPDIVAIGNSNSSYYYLPNTLAAPVLVAPGNGAPNQILPVALRWMSVLGASTYQLQISTAADFAVLVVNDSTLSDTMKQVSGLANNRTYYWRVRARTPVEIGPFAGPGFMFSTRPAETPLLLGEYQRDANTALLLHLDEASGSSVLDASGSYNDGRMSGVSRLVGRFGNGIKLPTTTIDSGIVVTKNSTVNISSPMTLECWYKTSAYDIQGVNLIANSSKYSLMLGASVNMGYLQFFCPSSGSWSVYQSNTQISLGRWTHLAGVWDGGTPVLYIDGVLTPVEYLQQSDFGVDRGVMFIGSHWNQNQTSTSLTVIDEIRVSSKVRAPQEFNLQLPPKDLLTSPSNMTVSLSWQNGGGMVPLLRYRVYRGADSATVTLIDSTVSTSYVNTGLSVGTTYYYRISAVDSTGFESAKSESKAATTLNLLPPLLVQPADYSTAQAPSVELCWRSVPQAFRYHIQISCSPSFLWYAENDSTITDTVRAVAGLAYNTTYYWRVATIGAGGRSAFASPAFRFRTRDTLSFVASTVHNFTSWQASTDYRILSFPGTTNFTATQLLTGKQKTDWRVYEDNGGTPPNHLTELDINGTITPGKGYWLLRQGSLTFSQTVTMPGLDTSGACTINLRGGWNIIGNPLDRTVNWDAVRQANGSLTSSLFAYGGSTGFQPSLQMEPFTGYYFYNATGLQSLKILYSFAGRPAKASPDPPLLWRLQIAFEASQNQDLENVVGVGSSNAVDIASHNQRKPPSFMDQASLYFVFPDNDGNVGRFSTDFRPATADGICWDFEVHNPLLSGAKIRLLGLDDVSVEYQVCLISRCNSRPNDMRKNHTYAYQTVAEKMSFRLIVGKQGFVDSQIASLLPREFRLDQNYPNPFNPTTTISFSVPKVANIGIAVFSPIGQRVAKLADGPCEPGVFTVTWNGMNETGTKVASGTYFCCMVVDGRLVNTKTMVLLK